MNSNKAQCWNSFLGKTNKFIQSRLIDRDIHVDPKHVCKLKAKNKFEFTEQPIIAKIKAPPAD